MKRPAGANTNIGGAQGPGKRSRASSASGSGDNRQSQPQPPRGRGRGRPAFQRPAAAVSVGQVDATPPKRLSRSNFASPGLPGPATKEEVARWAPDLLTRLMDSADGVSAMIRLKNMLHHTEIHISSDFSGFDCPGEAWRVLLACITEQLSSQSPAATRPEVWSCNNWVETLQGLELGGHKVLRVCDNDKTCQDMLGQIHGESMDTCLFSDIGERLSDKANEELDSMEPVEGASLKKQEKCRLQQLGFVLQHEEEFGPEATSGCMWHGMDCPAVPKADTQVQGHRKLRGNIAGTSCVAWTTTGKNERFAHASQRAHAVWVGERLSVAGSPVVKAREDFFIQECTVRYDWQSQLAPLADKWVMVRLLVDPRDLGYPTSRPRSYVIGINRATLAWTGPNPQNALAVQDDYASIFVRNCVSTGQVYMNAEPAEVVQEMRRRAAVQKCFWPEDIDVAQILADAKVGKNLSVATDLLRETMWPGHWARFEDWEKLRQESGHHHFFADADHNAGARGPTAGPHMPCELRHGSVISHHDLRHATPFEVLSAHGFHLHKVAPEIPVSPYKEALSKLDVPQVQALGGNGMSLPGITSVYLYMLSNVQWLDQVAQPRREIMLGKRGHTCFFEEADASTEQDPDSE